MQLLKLIMGVKVLNVRQARKMMSIACDFVHLKNGTYLQSSKDRWAIKVHEEGWSGYWIPFKDQSSRKNENIALNAGHTSTRIGEGCDLVVLAIHGMCEKNRV
jgi:hypothetical protein